MFAADTKRSARISAWFVGNIKTQWFFVLVENAAEVLFDA